VADCSRGGIRQPEMHDHQQWTAVYVGSPAARMTTTIVCVLYVCTLCVTNKTNISDETNAAVNARQGVRNSSMHFVGRVARVQHISSSCCTVCSSEANIILEVTVGRPSLAPSGRGRRPIVNRLTPPFMVESSEP